MFGGFLPLISLSLVNLTGTQLAGVAYSIAPLLRCLAATLSPTGRPALQILRMAFHDDLLDSASRSGESDRRLVFFSSFKTGVSVMPSRIQVATVTMGAETTNGTRGMIRGGAGVSLMPRSQCG